MKKRITYLTLENNSAKLPDDFVSFLSVSKKEIINGKRKQNTYCSYFWGGVDPYFDEKFMEHDSCLFVFSKKKTRWYRFLEFLRKRKIFYRVEYISSK